MLMPVQRPRPVLSLLLILAMLAAPGLVLAQEGSTPSFTIPPGAVIIGDDTGLVTFLADGSERTVVLENTDSGCWLRDGVWSPDGSQVLYTRICGGSSPTDWHATNADGEPDPARTASVFVFDLNTGASSELAPNDGEYQDYAGDWHPDGDRVVIYSNRNLNRYNLYTIDLASGEADQITDFESDLGRVSYDPTGQYLLYNRYIADTSGIRWEVRVLDTETDTETFVAAGLTPHWSPDGQWIAYATEGDTADVFVMPAACVYEGTGCNASDSARNITLTPVISEREPLWSADQTQLIYLRDTSPEPASESWDLFRHELRTGLLQNLTNTADVSERVSDWQPGGAEPADVAALLPTVVRVITGTANLREGPSTNTSIVGTLNNGQVVYVQGVNAAGDWYRITLPEDGTVAWLFADLTQVVSGEIEGLPEIVAE